MEEGRREAFTARSLGAMGRLLVRVPIVPGLLVLLLTGTCFPSETVVVVNKAFHGREVKLRVGDALRVELEQPGATGYEWQLRAPEPSLLDVVSVETTDHPGPDRTGTPVTKAWLLRAKQSGKAELRFLCFRPWEGESSAVERFTLNVRIP